MATAFDRLPVHGPRRVRRRDELRREEPGAPVAQLARARLDRRGRAAQVRGHGADHAGLGARRPGAHRRPRGLAPARRAGADRARHLGARSRQPQRHLRRGPAGRRRRCCPTARASAWAAPTSCCATRREASPVELWPERELRRPDRRQHADARAVRADVARRAERRAGADPGRDRHGQGAGGARDPRRVGARGRAVRDRRLRGAGRAR